MPGISVAPVHVHARAGSGNLLAARLQPALHHLDLVRLRHVDAQAELLHVALRGARRAAASTISTAWAWWPIMPCMNLTSAAVACTFERSLAWSAAITRLASPGAPGWMISAGFAALPPFGAVACFCPGIGAAGPSGGSRQKECCDELFQWLIPSVSIRGTKVRALHASH